MIYGPCDESYGGNQVAEDIVFWEIEMLPLAEYLDFYLIIFDEQEFCILYNAKHLTRINSWLDTIHLYYSSYQINFI